MKVLFSFYCSAYLHSGVFEGKRAGVVLESRFGEVVVQWSDEETGCDGRTDEVSRVLVSRIRGCSRILLKASRTNSCRLPGRGVMMTGCSARGGVAIGRYWDGVLKSSKGRGKRSAQTFRTTSSWMPSRVTNKSAPCPEKSWSLSVVPLPGSFAGRSSCRCIRSREELPTMQRKRRVAGDEGDQGRDADGSFNEALQQRGTRMMGRGQEARRGRVWDKIWKSLMKRSVARAHRA